ncbi:LysE family translocator, partial [candidate division KSB1 bacterium]|nr:LysE family translocator [candidate division KSB1 bacterium]
DVKSHSLRKGIIVNFLNPSPYLFWFSVGAPTIVRAADVGNLAIALFIVAMYLCLVGSKIIIAILVGKSKSVLKSRYYIWLIRGLGLALFVFAFIFFKSGIQLLMK